MNNKSQFKLIVNQLKLHISNINDENNNRNKFNLKLTLKYVN